jgi:hypothetical protein
MHARLAVLAPVVLAVVAAGCIPVASPAPASEPVVTIPPPTVAVPPPLSPASPPPDCPVPTAADPTRVILYGDSLASEAAAEFAARLCAPDVEVLTSTQPGAALCDFTTTIESDVDARAPDLVLIQFSGNNITPCVADPQGHPLVGDALLDRYGADAEQLATALDGRPVAVAWVAHPGAAGAGEPPLRDVYAAVVASHAGSSFLIDGGVGLRDPSGTYRLELPCLPEEVALSSCFQQRIIVRLPLDGFHFCPVLASGACPVYNAGAVRFGRALADPVRARLGL